MRRFFIALIGATVCASTALGQPLPPQTVTPVGTPAKNAVTIQGSSSGTPIPVTGSLSVSGAANTAGSTATFNANAVCATVWLAGQPGASFTLAAGTLAATLTPSFSTDATQSGNNCTGGTYTTTSFIDPTTGNTSASIVVTNPNSLTVQNVRLGSAACARVCTTAYTGGTATGFLLATVANATLAPAADVTDRAGRLLGVTYGSDGNKLATANTGRLQVDIISGGGSNSSVGATASAVPSSATYAGMNVAGNLTGLTGTANGLKVDPSAVTSPVSASSLPLPTGASTSALQTSLNALFPTTLDGSGFFKTHEQGTAAISAASLPLPSGAATAAKQPALGTAGTASADVISVQGVASMTALKVDPSGVTSPVSAASLPLPAGASTAAKQPALGTAGSASADVISVQGVASMTALKVDPSAVTSPVSAAALPLPAGASTAAKQPALGTAGTPSTDVLTVQGASSMTALKVDPSAVTSPVSLASLPALAAGTNVIGHVISDSGSTTAVTSLPAIPSGTNVIGHVIADSGSTTAVTSLPALPAGTNAIGTVQIGNTANTTPILASVNDGTNTAKVEAASTAAAAADKALVVAQSPNIAEQCPSILAISQTSSTDVLTSTNKLHICSIVLVSATAQSIALIEGTGTVCATGTPIALIGSTTVANGPALAANGGFVVAAGIPWLKTQTTAHHLCVLQSGTGNLSGVITYADQ